MKSVNIIVHIYMFSNIRIWVEQNGVFYIWADKKETHQDINQDALLKILYYEYKLYLFDVDIFLVIKSILLDIFICRK